MFGLQFLPIIVLAKPLSIASHGLSLEIKSKNYGQLKS